MPNAGNVLTLSIFFFFSFLYVFIGVCARTLSRATAQEVKVEDNLRESGTRFQVIRLDGRHLCPLNNLVSLFLFLIQGFM